MGPNVRTVWTPPHFRDQFWILYRACYRPFLKTTATAQALLAAQILQIACAVAPNGPVLLVFRFLSGCFAAAPLTNSGAILADM
jgi:MFS family permease